MPGWLASIAQGVPAIPAMNAAVRIGQMGASLADVSLELRTLAIETGIFAGLAIAGQVVREKYSVGSR